MNAVISSQITGTPAEVEELTLDDWKTSGFTQGDQAYLQQFWNLSFLSMQGCGIKSLQNFPKIPSLLRLDLSGNQIKGGLENLATLTDLIQLNLANNDIRQFEDLSPLQQIDTITSLDLQHTPISQLDEYRDRIFEMFPNLIILDGMDVTGDHENLDNPAEEEEEDDELTKLQEEDEDDHNVKDGHDALDPLSPE